jgi:hypothetical protein
MPVSTAPKPLYNPKAVSRFTISFPVVRNPRFGAYNSECQPHILCGSISLRKLGLEEGRDILLARVLVLTIAFGL